MKLSRFVSVSALSTFVLLAALGCSSPGSRIKANQAAFDALPAETQTKIRAGKVEVGYTAAMVKMALGEPDRRYTRTTEKGSSEVWAYRDRGPALSLGFGVGGGSGSTGMGAGIGVSTAGDRDEDKIRVVLEGDKVTAVESSSR